MSYFANFTEILTNEKSELMICRLFIGQKFRKKFTPTPALYPSSKISDSGEGGGVKIMGRGKKKFARMDIRYNYIPIDVEAGCSFINRLGRIVKP